VDVLEDCREDRAMSHEPKVLMFHSSIDLREREERDAEVILFPRIRERLVDLVKSWNARGYQVSNNRRGRMVVKKASRAKLIFDRIRRNGR
jgi:hypothetical protein